MPAQAVLVVSMHTTARYVGKLARKFARTCISKSKLGVPAGVWGSVRVLRTRTLGRSVAARWLRRVPMCAVYAVDWLQPVALFILRACCSTHAALCGPMPCSPGGGLKRACCPRTCSNYSGDRGSQTDTVYITIVLSGCGLKKQPCSSRCQFGGIWAGSAWPVRELSAVQAHTSRVVLCAVILLSWSVRPAYFTASLAKERIAVRCQWRHVTPVGMYCSGLAHVKLWKHFLTQVHYYCCVLCSSDLASHREPERGRAHPACNHDDPQRCARRNSVSW
jgi:hypothetical protein